MDGILKTLGTPTNGILLGTILLILFVAFGRMFLSYLRKNVALWSVPGPLAYPFVGNALMFRRGPEEFFKVIRECRDRYGTIFRIWIGQRPFVFLCGADVVQPVLSSSVHIEKSEEYRCVEPWLGTGLITSGGNKWHMRRKLLTGAFHSTLLDSYTDSLEKEASQLTSILLAQIPKEPPPSWSDPIDVCKLTKLSALDAICETIMGFNISALEGNSNKDYINAIERVNQILQRRFITPWLISDFVFYRTKLGKEFEKHLKIIHNFTDHVIKERKVELAARKETSQLTSEGRPKRKSLLDLLLDMSDNGRVLSDEDIREEVDTFMFAGHDTTATAINWSLYSLGHHPEVQTQILEEAASVLDESGGEEINLNQIGKMEYLDRCVREVLRLYPSVPMIGRELHSPLTIKEYTFTSGIALNLSTFVLHRDPKYFPEPEKFDPDRFLPSETIDRHSFAYAPFSAGSRNCIGQKFALMEIKMVILRLLQSLEVKSLCKPKDLKLQGEIILNSPDGIHLSFRRRQKS